MCSAYFVGESDSKLRCDLAAANARIKELEAQLARFDLGTCETCEKWAKDRFYVVGADMCSMNEWYSNADDYCSRWQGKEEE